MIGSILRVLQGKAAAQTLTTDIAGGVTRQDFFRLVGAGALASGLGVAAAAHARGAVRKRHSGAVTDLDQVYDVWQDRLNSGDIDGLVDLYVGDVTYVNPEGKHMQGDASVRADFAAIVALKPRIVLGDRKHIRYHDTVLTTNHWRMNHDGPNGTRQDTTGGGIEVLRRQADGGWRFIIDDASRSAV